MINFEVSADQAISLLLLIDREQSAYSTDDTCPQRVVLLRELAAELDTKLTNHYEQDS